MNIFERTGKLIHSQQCYNSDFYGLGFLEKDKILFTSGTDVSYKPSSYDPKSLQATYKNYLKRYRPDGTEISVIDTPIDIGVHCLSVHSDLKMIAFGNNNKVSILDMERSKLYRYISPDVKGKSPDIISDSQEPKWTLARLKTYRMALLPVRSFF